MAGGIVSSVTAQGNANVYRISLGGRHCEFTWSDGAGADVAAWRDELSLEDRRVRSDCTSLKKTALPISHPLCESSILQAGASNDFSVTVAVTSRPTAQAESSAVQLCLCRLYYAQTFCHSQHKSLPNWFMDSPVLHNVESLAPVEISDIMSPLNWIATYTVFQMVLLAPTLHLLRWCCKGSRPYPVEPRAGDTF